MRSSFCYQACSLLLVFVHMIASGWCDSINLVIKGDLQSGDYAPIMVNLESEKRMAMKEHSRVESSPGFETETVWKIDRKRLGSRCRVLIYDINFGICEKCVAWKDYEIDKSTKSLVFELSEIKVSVVVKIDSGKYRIPPYGVTKNRVLVRFRRIDEAGVVRIVEAADWTKPTEIEFFQAGDYVVDILAEGVGVDGKGNKLDSEKKHLGYPVWAKKIRITEETKTIKLEYDEL